MQTARSVSLPEFGLAEGGSRICVAEQGIDVPFYIRRVYWIYSGPEASTHGHHAHLNAEQMLVCVSGAARVEVTGRDGLTGQFDLSAPSQGLKIAPQSWLVVSLRPHSVLLCLSSVPYAEQQTVYDLGEFLKGR